MALLVQKFGGTCVQSLERIKDVARRILLSQKSGHELVIVVSAMAGETNRLLELAKELTPKPSRRELDVLLATGEQVTASLLAMAIQESGASAVSFLGHQIQIITDDLYSKAKIRSVDIGKIKNALKNDHIIIIAGFQGVSSGGNITTLGRGGSDITAACLASALRASRVEFYKDVEGIFTADPSICPAARLISKISYEEMLELSHLGAKVLHPRAVELARRGGIPIVVRSSLTSNPGSSVVPEEEIMEHVVVSGIVYDRNQVKVSLKGIPNVPDILAKILTAVAEKDINIDMIVQSAMSEGRLTDLSFTCSKEDRDMSVQTAEKIVEDLPEGEYHIHDNLAKISIIGAGMKSHSGVASKMFTALAEEGINIFMVNTSEIKISCLIEAKYAELSVRILHDIFEPGK